MSHGSPALVGSVFERKPTSNAPPKAFTPTKTGFPAVQHRSKSAFARNREESRKAGPSRLRDAPAVVPSQNLPAPEPIDSDDWRAQMSRENEERVASMTQEERDRERQEIIGAGVGDLLKRVKQAREKHSSGAHAVPIPDPIASSLEEVPITPRETYEQQLPSQETHRVLSPPPALSTGGTRPPSRTDRKLRFAELAPEDVHVYESAPPSPRRKTLALPAPTNDGSAISLGQFYGKLGPHEPRPPPEAPPEPEEGSAEYIRRRYFPDAPANDPNLAWMQHSAEPSNSEFISPALRFDLSGKPIPTALSSTLPTHLGLHHHAEGAHAGYTLDDIFLLSRSTVPAQRATMLGVLAKIAERISKMVRGEINEMQEVKGQEEELRKRILAAGVEAMMERGSVGARAVEAIWQCIVGWDEDIMAFEGVELETSTDSAINSLRLEFLLPNIATLFGQGAISEETRSQLVRILHRLAQHNNDFASSIVTTPKLIASVVQTFLLTPIPPSESSPLPEPLALELLVVLATASRANAAALQEPADALLRFITFLPSSSMYPAPLATSLSRSTLRFYTVLARYGLYSHIATAAAERFSKLGQYILSDACSSARLMVAWTDLLTAWTVCAVDPHQTTPGHEILWSQVTAWGWNSEVLDLSGRLGAEEKDWPVWAGVWRVTAAWLEGARVNGVRGGSSERAEALEVLRSGFEDGKEKDVVLGCLDVIQRELGRVASVPIAHGQLPHLRAVAGHASTLAAAIRLWLACLPPPSDGPLTSPPFPLPFPKISDLCAKITVHPAWSLLTSADGRRPAYVSLRSLSELLSVYLCLSQRLPDISEELWAAQGLAILAKLLPGDEDFAAQTADELLGLVGPRWATKAGIQSPSAVWERSGMAVIKPFLAHRIRPHRDTFIGPAVPTPQSISQATTQRLPSPIALPTYGLPVNREWTLTPLDHLLRSGSSEVFKALPADWDASEIDIVQASLLLTKVCREVLQHFALRDFVLTRDEAVFGCMKVFMLEHGQPQTDSTEEVYRDRLVGQLMDALLQPYTAFATPVGPGTTPVVPSAAQENLEQVAARFLGKTPFYQYYTDFVGLYDAVSFSHPLFARLLLPPTSMRYPLDYRKYLWNDFGHIMKTIRTPVDQVICEDIREYLWPLEKDAQMLGSYLRALLKDHLQGFVHLVALHHVAGNIWPDLHGPEWGEDRASKLLKAVVNQGGHDVVKEVVLYRQHKTGATLLPPLCFGDLADHVKTARLKCITGWGLGDRLHGLLIEP
ncbi:putative RPAP1-like, C-terminal [Lyophyllum shimeji]|uniref:RPAP1-like, C-terminal n=1 Tax=Lyophyllum shimeji TaxID=47721 RepID=A0A9P3PN92_LYOSH|nr:putative RPAP1-like, C-terminal [Lyophyllum shimeji]